MRHADEGCDEGEDAEEGDGVETELRAAREVIGVGVGKVFRRQRRLRGRCVAHVGVCCGRGVSTTILRSDEKLRRVAGILKGRPVSAAAALRACRYPRSRRTRAVEEAQ